MSLEERAKGSLDLGSRNLPLSEPDAGTREAEWFVPKFGPRRFRAAVGLSFYPYSLMNASYVLLGSLIAPGPVHWDRLAALAVVYLLAVGVSAHALDALAPNKPWGDAISRRWLLALASTSLALALGIGFYYSVAFAPYLLIVGSAEVFFLFSYNLELFGGRFHTDRWFAFSWGMLPVLAGYVAQTNALSVTSLGAGAFGALTAFAEISASRPYKSQKKLGLRASSDTAKFESILKALVGSHLLLAVTLALYRAYA